MALEIEIELIHRLGVIQKTGTSFRCQFISLQLIIVIHNFKNVKKE